MEIKDADPSDAEELLVLQKLAYLSEAEIYGDYSIQPLTQTVEEVREEIEGRIVLKAVEGVAIVGSVRAAVSGGTCSVCSVGKLAVHPDWQGRGIGTSLMCEVESRCPDAVKFSLFTGHRSERNIHLYERLGYVESHREKVGDTLTMVHMEKTRHSDGG